MADVQKVLVPMRACVIIPVHNEAAVIGLLVADLKRKGYDVLVIEDGSTDHSGSIAKENGAVVLTHEKKKGKGVSLRDGFDYALKQNYDGVIAMDGDGQHDVLDIDKFLRTVKETGSDIVTGNRMENHKGMPLVRLLTNKLMSGMISLICRQRIPDTQCGFRYISADVLKAVRLSSSDFEIESEVLIKASKMGFKIGSVPIKTIYRNELSKINPLVDTVRFFVYLLRELCSPNPRQRDR